MTRAGSIPITFGCREKNEGGSNSSGDMTKSDHGRKSSPIQAEFELFTRNFENCWKIKIELSNALKPNQINQSN